MKIDLTKTIKNHDGSDVVINGETLTVKNIIITSLKQAAPAGSNLEYDEEHKRKVALLNREFIEAAGKTLEIKDLEKIALVKKYIGWFQNGEIILQCDKFFEI